jgi:hypothetical protein
MTHSVNRQVAKYSGLESDRNLLVELELLPFFKKRGPRVTFFL